MSILDIKEKRKLIKTAVITLAAAALCFAFGMVYEHFSYGVYSSNMILAFLYPLCGGTFAALIYLVLPVRYVPGFLPRHLWLCGIAWLTVGSIINGVLEIYGTTNRLTAVYPIAGILMMVIAAIVYLVGILLRRKQYPPNT